MIDENKLSLLNFGIIVIDKPAGPTSFFISNYIRNRMGLKKTSHFGTLDPAVTGVLPIALGRACRLTGTFLGHDKEYIGIIHTHKEQNLKDLQKIIDEKFSGKIMQLPPRKSRVKREIREREIKKFKLLEMSVDKKDFLFIAQVQGGTYIRKLCSDLGELIGGAHMTQLRRINAGIFSEAQSISIYDFDKAVDEYKNGNSVKLNSIILPAEKVIKKILQSCQIKEDSLQHLKTGKPLMKGDLANSLLPQERKFAVFSKEKFVGIYNRVKENDIIGRAEFVFN